MSWNDIQKNANANAWRVSVGGALDGAQKNRSPRMRQNQMMRTPLIRFKRRSREVDKPIPVHVPVPVPIPIPIPIPIARAISEDRGKLSPESHSPGSHHLLIIRVLT